MLPHIVVVEDEPAIAESVAYSLEREGYRASTASTLEAGRRAAAEADLVVLDLMLPDGSGVDLLADLRRHGRGTPVIVLSSRDQESDRVMALERGADDYVTKPFSPREVVARVRAVLRRAQPPAGAGEASTAVLRVEAATRRAYAGSAALDLTRVEFDLLASLLGEPGRVYTRSELIDTVWGSGHAITDRTVDSHVKALRRKLAESGADPALIETVRGVGYRALRTDSEGERP